MIRLYSNLWAKDWEETNALCRYECGLVRKAKIRCPGYLEPSAYIVLRAIHVRRDQEALILREGLHRPVAIQRDGAIEEAVGDGGAAGKK